MAEKSSAFDVLFKFAAILAGLSFAALVELSGRQPPLKGELSWAFDGFLISSLLNAYGVTSWFGYNRDNEIPHPSVYWACIGGVTGFLVGTSFLVKSVSHRSFFVGSGVFALLAIFFVRNVIADTRALRIANPEKTKSQEPPKG